MTGKTAWPHPSDEAIIYATLLYFAPIDTGRKQLNLHGRYCRSAASAVWRAVLSGWPLPHMDVQLVQNLARAYTHAETRPTNSPGYVAGGAVSCIMSNANHGSPAASSTPPAEGTSARSPNGSYKHTTDLADAIPPRTSDMALSLLFAVIGDKNFRPFCQLRHHSRKNRLVWKLRPRNASPQRASCPASCIFSAAI